MMRRESKMKLRRFWNDRGFSLVLVLCVAAIGISGYLLFFGQQKKELEDLTLPALWQEENLGADAADAVTEPILVELPKDAQRESRVVMTDDYLAAEAAGAAEIEEYESITGGEPEDAEPRSELLGTAEAVSGSAEIPAEHPGEGAEVPAVEEEPAAVEVVAPFFVWPVSGEVLSDFSVDELVFNATTEDWRVPTGVDIAAAAGTLVGAIGDGVVEDVYEDELMGSTVVINHGDGLRSVSCGLMRDIPVTVGQQVRAGAVIGGVGGPEALPCEGAISSHLHLECIGGGAQVNPLEILP